MATVYSGVFDIVLAILPWKIVWNVTINRKEKLGVLVAMSMGVLYASIPAPPICNRLLTDWWNKFWHHRVSEDYLPQGHLGQQQ